MGEPGEDDWCLTSGSISTVVGSGTLCSAMYLDWEMDGGGAEYLIMELGEYLGEQRTSSPSPFAIGYGVFSTSRFFFFC